MITYHNPMTLDNYREALYAMRKRAKLSQATIEDKLDICRSSLSHWENGRLLLKVRSLIQIADVCGYEIHIIQKEKKP